MKFAAVGGLSPGVAFSEEEYEKGNHHQLCQNCDWHFSRFAERVPVEFLGATAIQGVIECSNLDKDLVNDVIMGHTLPSGEAANIARVCLLLAGLSEETPGFTACRMCASGI